MPHPLQAPVRFPFSVAMVGLSQTPGLLTAARFNLVHLDPDPQAPDVEVEGMPPDHTAPSPWVHLTIDPDGMGGRLSVEEADVPTWSAHLGRVPTLEDLTALGQRMGAQMSTVLGEIEGEDEHGGEVVCWPEADARRYHPDVFAVPTPPRRSAP